MDLLDAHTIGYEEGHKVGLIKGVIIGLCISLACIFILVI